MAESEIDYLKAILKELRKLNRVMITNHHMQQQELDPHRHYDIK